MLAFLFTLLAVFAPLHSFASINNVAESNRLQAAAYKFPYGHYSITNVKTKRSLIYSKDSSGYNIYPGSGSGSLIEFQPHNQSTPYIRLKPIASGKVGKCISAQWNYTFCKGKGCDWAAVLYACAVDPRPKGSTLEFYKQFWLFVPRGTTPESYNIIPVDHINDMQTRGMRSCVRNTPHYSTCLDEIIFDDDDYAWYINLNGKPISPPSPTTQSQAVPTTSTSLAEDVASTTAISPTQNTAQPTNVPQNDCSVKTVAKTTVYKTKTVTRTVVKTATVTKRAVANFKMSDDQVANPATKNIDASVNDAEADDQDALYSFGVASQAEEPEPDITDDEAEKWLQPGAARQAWQDDVVYS